MYLHVCFIVAVGNMEIYNLITGFVVGIFFKILFQTRHCFLHVFGTSLLKTLKEKEKFLVTSNFSFPTVFSALLENCLLF